MAEKEIKKDVAKKEKKPSRIINALRRAKPALAMEAKTIEEPFDVLKFVLMTEKSVRMIESENKLVFIVNRRSSKNEIASAFENVFESPVSSVTTVLDQKNRKKAFVKLKNPGAAGEIAIRLGII
ncbi:MAG: 50S ribosomal protein L23 [Candidatus Aenigmarchaeota archaeon]|nr:50S ribosomal protein L23 [Candidatus Aenigmarchaeota archaeon]